GRGADDAPGPVFARRSALMFALALRSLRFRIGSFLATFIAMFFGAAMVIACGGLMETGIRADAPPQRLVKAPIVVTGNPSYHLIRSDESLLLPERIRLDPDTVRTLEGIPGVGRVVPDSEFRAVVNGKPVEGRNWDSALLAPYSLRSGSAPGPGEVVLRNAHVGDRITVTVRGQPRTFRVAGTAAAPTVHSGPSVFFSAADARQFAAQPDSAGILLAPGADVRTVRDRIEKALPDKRFSILTGSDRGFAEFPEARGGKETLVVMAGVFGGLATAVAIFVIASTLALTVQHRQRELALLRTVGTTARQLRRMVLAEALTVSVLATALGVLPGVALGRALYDQLTRHDVVPEVIAYHQGWIPKLVGCGAAVLAAIVAAFVAGRRAGRIHPIQALAEAADEKRWLSPIRVILALLFLGGGFALLLVTATVMSGPTAASTAGPSILLWAIGFALLGPGLTRFATWLLYPLVRLLTGMGGRLALLNLRARTVPMAAAVVPVMLATAIATANLYMQTTQDAAADHAYLRNLHADAVLTSHSGGFPATVLDAVRKTPGVAAVSAFATSTGAIDSPHDGKQDEDGLPLQGVQADSAARVTGIRTTAGSLHNLTGDTVALPAGRAERLHLHVGDPVTLRLGDRSTQKVHVVALFAAAKGYDTIVLPVDLLAPHTTSGTPDQLMVRFDSGADRSALAARLRSVAATVPGISVDDRNALIAHNRDDRKIQAWINYLLVGMIVAYTAVSIVNTLAAATSRRRREFGLQRLAGSTRAQVLRMLGTEGVLIAVSGVALGTGVAMLTLLPFCAALGDSRRPSGPVWIYLAIAGTALVLTLSATLVPAWAALRRRPADAVAAP
ncbi:MAG TPA: FtsX-like permease family protein, partial [Mycobacteriales bacterium]|nr:FtsX-like permease family protein [Mycobacteriales bacterium]